MRKRGLGCGWRRRGRIRRGYQCGVVGHYIPTTYLPTFPGPIALRRWPWGTVAFSQVRESCACLCTVQKHHRRCRSNDNLEGAAADMTWQISTPASSRFVRGGLKQRQALANGSALAITGGPRDPRLPGSQPTPPTNPTHKLPSTARFVQWASAQCQVHLMAQSPGFIVLTGDSE